MPRPRAARLDDVDAARAGGGARVDDRHAARKNRPQHPGGRARREHLEPAALDERPVVAHAQFLDPRRAHLRHDAAQAIGQPNPRLQPLHLVRVDGRKIHRVANRAVAQEIAHRRRRLDPNELLRFFGGRGDVRRRDHLRQLRERPVGGRLGLEHVERRGGDDAAVDRAAQRRFVDELAARGVDQPDARLASREPPIVEEMARLGRRRQVQRQIVGRGADLVERQELDAEPRRDLRRDVRIVRDDAHAERAGALRNLLADAAQAGDAERLAAQLGAEEALLLPPGVLHRAIGGGNRSRHRQHQRARVLGDADAVRARRVDDENSAAARGGDVHVVHASARARDDPQAGRRVEQARVHFRRTANEQRIGVGEIAGERVGRSARP